MSPSGSSARHRPLNVGITYLAGMGGTWAAGAIYANNLVQAVRAADLSRELSIVLLAPAYHRPVSFLAGGSDRNSALYSHMTADARYRKAVKAALSIVRSGILCSFERQLRRRAIDVIFPAVPFAPELAPQVVPIEWVPDFQHLHLPEFFPGPALEARTESIRRRVANARAIVVGDAVALRDMAEHYPDALPRTRALPFTNFPVDDWFREPPGPSVRRRLDFDDYIIFPSQFWKHKNHATLFDAMRILRDRGHAGIRLVCTGCEDDHRNPAHVPELRRWIRKNGMESRIVSLGLLARHEQIQLMRQARLVAQPSRFEGWSALLEDCQMLGKPAVASDIPMHREQSPPDVTFFPSLDADALASAIQRVWTETAPGWNEAKETRARERQRGRAVDFANRFNRVVREFLKTV